MTHSNSSQPHLRPRLAILECDVPLPNTNAQYLGYGGVFKALLNAGAESICYQSEREAVRKADERVGCANTDGDEDETERKEPIEYSVYNVFTHEEVYPDLEEIDAILITGSRHDSFASTPWIVRLVEYAKRALAHPRIRLIGVCFGHQIIGRALDAPVGRSDGGWEITVSEVQLTEKGREIFGKDELFLHQMHKDVIHSVPSLSLLHQRQAQIPPESPPLFLLGSSPKCAIQGLYTPGKFITIQAHPEFTEPIVQELLETRHTQGVFGDDIFKEAMGRVGKRHDGFLVGGVFVRFLIDGLGFKG